MKDNNIEIYIDRIVLEGFDHLNKEELTFVVQERLVTMISEQGISSGLTNTPYHRKLNGGEMKLIDHVSTGKVGGDIAGGIFNGINSVE